MQQQQSNGNSILIQGRIVWTMGGNLFEGKVKTDMNTKQVVIDQKTGQPKVEYGFGLAIPKIDPRTGQHHAEYVKVWNALHQEAFTLYPSGQIPPSFAMKYKDGDGIDHNGQSFATREGHAGHIVLACTTQIPIKYFRFEGGNNILVNDGFKCGDYVEVQLNIKAHPAVGTAKPGLYLNPSAVRLIQPGKEIINTPSGDQIFGQTAPSYQGEIVAPTAAPMPQMGQQPQHTPAAPAAPAMPQMGQQPQHTPAAPAAPAMPAQTQNVAPNYQVLPQNFQPQHTPAAPAAPAMPQMQPQQTAMPATPNTPPQQPYANPAYPQMPAMPGVGQ